MNDIWELEDSIFQVLDYIEKARKSNNLAEFSNCIKALELLNDKYAINNYGIAFISKSTINMLKEELDNGLYR